MNVDDYSSTSIPSFEALINRADEETLQQIIGRGELRLLRMLDEELVSPRRLKALVLAQYDAISLMRQSRVRGLLLPTLKPREAAKLCDKLGLPGDNPFRTLSNLSPRRGSSLEQTLLQALSITPAPVAVLEQPPGKQEVCVKYPLFPHQNVAVDAVMDALGRAPRRVLLHMPTGSGKTRTAMHAISRLLSKKQPAVAIWLAYSEELCEQAASEFAEAWATLGNRDLHVYRFFGNSSVQLEDVTDGLIVAGLDKTFQRATRDSSFLLNLGDKVSVVTIDEAHQAVAPTYRHVLELLAERRSDTALLGLTATPGRTWNDPQADRELADFFESNKVTLETPGYDSPVDFLIDQQYLANPTFVSLTYPTGLELTPKEAALLSRSLDIPESILARLTEDESRNLAILRKVEDVVRRHSRTIVFANTVHHAQLLSAILNVRGIDANVVTGQTDSDERKKKIARFKSNSPGAQVLVNYGVLTTGFDAPRTSACVISRPTKSLVLYSQMVGRAIRGPNAGGNRYAEIVTVVDTNLPGFGDLSEAFTNWEDVW